MKLFAITLTGILMATVGTPLYGAAIFYSPDSASATNTDLAGSSPTHLIDQSGLSAIEYQSFGCSSLANV